MWGIEDLTEVYKDVFYKIVNALLYGDDQYNEDPHQPQLDQRIRTW